MTKSKIQKRSFPVLEMSCAACAGSVESILKNTKGIIQASVNYADNSAQIEWNSDLLSELDIQSAVRLIGYDIIIESQHEEEEKEKAFLQSYLDLKNRTIWAAILTTPVFIIGMFFMHMPYGNWISFILSAPVVFYFGRHFFISAWKKLKHKTTNMDTLVAMSTGVAFVFSAFNTIYPEFWTNRGLHPHVYFEASSVVIVFISLGKLLEEKAKSNTSTAIKKLMGLQPKTVRINKDGEEVDIPISEVKINDIIIARPGEKMAVDGIVVEGHSYIDESMISGESIPVEKIKGGKVFAGTINQKGSFKYKAEKVGQETVLAQIIKLVKEAQSSKAPVQQLADKIAGVFVPVVISISTITFIAWMIFADQDAFNHALMSSVTVLVIACPCALGLATPTAIMVGVGKGAEYHILIKDAESLELAQQINTVILDKTGTITKGKPSVTDFRWHVPEKTELKNILYTLESRSEHPLADAIIQYLNQESISLIGLTSIESLTGKGIQAKYQDQFFYVGNLYLLKEKNIFIDTETASWISEREREAKTIVLFFNDKTLLSVIAIRDQIKDSSKLAVRLLQDENIDVIMLTGDQEQTAKAVAENVGIKQFKSGMLPTDKAHFISSLKQDGKIVAMVGDGINDSQALAIADVSIAMGKGSDIAMDVAKITLITSDLTSILKAIHLSKQINRGIKENLFWAFIYNIIGIPLAAGVLYPINGFLLNPMIAGAAMALSSVSVVANSLRIKTTKL